GIHVCSEIAAIIIPSEKFDVEPEALCLDLYPQQIYQTLLLRLRENYNSQPYHIPSKRKIYGIKRITRIDVCKQYSGGTVTTFETSTEWKPVFRTLLVRRL
ncbi:hypothetical protein HZS_7472, partial [Henneguya salminicola]